MQVDLECKEMGRRGNLEVRSESGVGQELKMAEDKLEKRCLGATLVEERAATLAGELREGKALCKTLSRARLGTEPYPRECWEPALA